ncbi:hypothetical protein F5X99DRAFT_370915 [Biscogniauxia marginata]|nr:hypothetical protein F5X99DRAFT_370915 [Biscogniauxia marginata]
MSEENLHIDLDTSLIREWRSIVTLIVFVLANIIVLFPFHIPVYVPRQLHNAFLDALASLRIIPPRKQHSRHGSGDEDDDNGKIKPFVCLRFPVNFITGPLIADLFLLAILAIGRQEVHDGIVGANNIAPYDIMIFFLTLAYIAISIDASGLIRFLAFKVLQKGGKVGHRLFFYLYAFFFALGSFIGNDPIILSGTAFLAYMTRVSSNIIHPRAWIHTQFAVANIASAILVSSNPTNLVLAGAFRIRFIDYTANMIVPVIFTAIFLFPLLLYIIFANESLIPFSIKMHELPEEAKARKPVNPNIPHARGNAEEEERMLENSEQGKLLSLEEIMNPFLDKKGAAFGAVIMTATLVTLLAINAAAQHNGETPVAYVTAPAAVVMFIWDVAFGWYHRHETRDIARRGRREVEQARAERAKREEEARLASLEKKEGDGAADDEATIRKFSSTEEQELKEINGSGKKRIENGLFITDSDDETTKGADVTDPRLHPSNHRLPPTLLVSEDGDVPSPVSVLPPESSALMLFPADDQPRNSRPSGNTTSALENQAAHPVTVTYPSRVLSDTGLHRDINEKKQKAHDQETGPDNNIPQMGAHQPETGKPTVVSLVGEYYRWLQETFPTATAVMAHLPFALVPFAFCMFILVQGLVTKGWVPVFAYGWDHWVEKTGTVGSIGGMGFLSVILCNFAGTNIGTTILLSRVIQAWQQIHYNNGTDISDRMFWGTVYSMALGVNYGAFSAAFSASLAGLLWRDILSRKHIHVRGLEFARVNLPIIAITMTVGCTVLVGEVYIMRHEGPYSL